MVMCVQQTLGSHRFQKKTIAIALQQKFDHRSSQSIPDIWEEMSHLLLLRSCTVTTS